MKKGVFILLLFVQTLLNAQVSLREVLAQEGASLRYDYWREVGYIEKENRQFVFRTGQSFLVEDYHRKVELGQIALGKDGDFFLTEKGAKLLSLLLQEEKEEQQKVAAIIIDAGHGGGDSGAVSPFSVNGGRIQEKEVVLDVALKTYAHLKRTYPDKRIFLTRDGDYFLTLEQRTHLANSVKLEKNEAILFVSVHANASFREKASGFEVWYLPPEVKRDMMSETMRKTLKEEGVAHILNRLLDEETTIESIKLADSILKGMDSKINGRSVNRGLKEESWYVVRNAKMPSVLIEVGFVSNKKEAALLDQKSYREDVALGIFDGISRFVQQFELSNGFTKMEAIGGALK